MPTSVSEQAPVPPPSYHRREVQAQARRARALHINALTLIETLHLLALCRLAVQLAHRRCPKNRSCLPPIWTKEELGKRSSIERFFGRVFLFFRLQRPPYSGWSTIVRQVALTYTASLVVALAAWQAHRPDLIRSPKRVLAHLWENSEL